MPVPKLSVVDLRSGIQRIYQDLCTPLALGPSLLIRVEDHSPHYDGFII